MAVALLIVICTTTIFFFQHQKNEHLAQIYRQGTQLAGLLSKYPLAQLTSSNNESRIIDSLPLQQNNPDFLYVIVFDRQGNVLKKISKTGYSLPDTVLVLEKPPINKAASLINPVTKHEILEFYAPLMSNTQLSGYIRLGLAKPGFSFNKSVLLFMSISAGLSILLAALFYFLMYQKVKPVLMMRKTIKNVTTNSNFRQKKPENSGDVPGIIEEFDNFIKMSKFKIDALESEKKDLFTTTRLLSYKNDRLNTILQSCPEGIMVLDESGEINYASSKLSSLLGLAPETILGKKPAECFSDVNLLSYLANHTEKYINNYSSKAHNFTVKDKAVKNIEARVYPVFSTTEPYAAFSSLVVFRDITEEQSAQASRNEFVAHISHELKTPLNVLSMYSESLLGEDGRDESFRIEAVNIIHDETLRLSTLINDLLNLSKIEMGNIAINKHRTKLHDLLTDIFTNVAHSDKNKNIDFKLNIPTNISPVSLDKDLLRIAINNLLTNAIKYSNTNGKVTLEAIETDYQIIISISDEGIGISEDDQKHIFEKFYRSENDEVRNRTGHGLGLTLANDIIQLHHGIMSVHSTPGKGSKFTIEFSKDESWVNKAI